MKTLPQPDDSSTILTYSTHNTIWEFTNMSIMADRYERE